MAASNLFESEALDEDQGSDARQTTWPKSLPVAEQLKKTRSVIGA
jgi:hypothetical protein